MPSLGTAKRIVVMSEASKFAQRAVSEMIKSFKVGCARTINLGNYQSLRIEALVEVEVELDPDAADATWIATKNAAQTELRQLMEETYRAQHKIDKP